MTPHTQIKEKSHAFSNESYTARAPNTLYQPLFKPRPVPPINSVVGMINTLECRIQDIFGFHKNEIKKINANFTSPLWYVHTSSNVEMNFSSSALLAKYNIQSPLFS